MLQLIWAACLIRSLRTVYTVHIPLVTFLEASSSLYLTNINGPKAMSMMPVASYNAQNETVSPLYAWHCIYAYSIIGATRKQYTLMALGNANRLINSANYFQECTFLGVFEKNPLYVHNWFATGISTFHYANTHGNKSYLEVCNY